MVLNKWLAGGDLNLQNFGQEWNEKNNAADMTVLRIAAKNVLYTVVNSNAMNAEVVAYPLGRNDHGAVGVSLAAWGFFAIRGSFKKI